LVRHPTLRIFTNHFPWHQTTYLLSQDNPSIPFNFTYRSAKNSTNPYQGFLLRLNLFGMSQ